MSSAGVVAFAVPRQVAFDYLTDPGHRAEWQSSLRRVADVVGPVGAGQTWTDVTWPGLRPAMRTTDFEPVERWAEDGTWHGVTASLTLTFADRADGCDVAFSFRIELPAVPAVLGRALTWASAPAVRADLKRAAQILAERS